MKPLAELAEEQFRLRQANARAAVRAGTIPLARAEAALRPWAALARHFGGALPETAGHVSIDICPTERTRATLAAARDVAIDRGDWDAAGPLIALAVEFLCPPYAPKSAHPEPVEGKDAA